MKLDKSCVKVFVNVQSINGHIHKAHFVCLRVRISLLKFEKLINCHENGHKVITLVALKFVNNKEVKCKNIEKILNDLLLSLKAELQEQQEQRFQLCG